MAPGKKLPPPDSAPGPRECRRCLERLPPEIAAPPLGALDAVAARPNADNGDADVAEAAGGAARAPSTATATPARRKATCRTERLIFPSVVGTATR
jgi:hypothetical protein